MKFNIAFIPGDGIGKEVIPAAEKVFLKLCEVYDIDVSVRRYELGYEYYRKTGKIWEENLPEKLKNECHAAVLGATGGEEGLNLHIIPKLRKELNLYANVRPVVPFSNTKINFVIVRENTEGLYSGIGGELGKIATDIRIISEEGSNRICRFACALAEKRKKKIVCVDKSNILRGCLYFRKIFKNIVKGFNVEWECMYIDAFILRMLQKPEELDVVVTTNMFGDILSEGSCYFLGSVGMAPSANIGDFAIFEPVHGSAPDISGKGVANPIASFMCVKMMLDYLHEKYLCEKALHAGKTLNEVVKSVYMKGIRTKDIGGSAKTDDVTHAVIREISMY